MDEALRKEQFYMAYIRVVAAQAGLQVVRPEVDDDSVDGVIMADFGRRPRLEVQAKATSLDTSGGDYIHFPLKIKNYNDLRMGTLHPRVLVVLIMPQGRSRLANAKPRAAVPASLRVLAYAARPSADIEHQHGDSGGTESQRLRLGATN